MTELYGARNALFAFWVLPAVDKLFTLFVNFVDLLFAHNSSNVVRLPQAVAAHNLKDFHNLLLIDNAAISDIQNWFETFVIISDLRRVLFVSDKGRNKIHWSWSVERNTRDDVVQTRRFEFFHKLLHASTFKLEHRIRLAAGNKVVNIRVVIFHVVKIDFYAMIFIDIVTRLLDVCQSSKPQKVHF